MIRKIDNDNYIDYKALAKMTHTNANQLDLDAIAEKSWAKGEPTWDPKQFIWKDGSLWVNYNGAHTLCSQSNDFSAWALRDVRKALNHDIHKDA